MRKGIYVIIANRAVSIRVTKAIGMRASIYISVTN